MTEHQKKRIEEMSNEDLVLAYKGQAVYNTCNMIVTGVEDELQQALFNEILRRMNGGDRRG